MQGVFKMKTLAIAAVVFGLCQMAGGAYLAYLIYNYDQFVLIVR